LTDRLIIKTRGNENNDELTKIMNLAFARALRLESEVSDYVASLIGMSGQLYRKFINNTIRMVSKPRYLEIGSWAGSTACAAMDKNCLKILCIDNWSEFGGPKVNFFQHVNAVKTPYCDFAFIESDFRSVDVSSIGLFNVYLFDGPHEEKDQYDGLALYDAALEDDFIFIVDDWNWQRVREGTLKAIRETGFNIDYAIEVRSTDDNNHPQVWGTGSDWHNGYFLSKLSRVKKRYDNIH